MTRIQHPIEAESYRILRSQVDTTALPPLTRAVTERVIHTSADLDYAADLVCDEDALRAGAQALAGRAPLVVDVRMLAAGITSRDAVVALDLAPSARSLTSPAFEPSATSEPTREPTSEPTWEPTSGRAQTSTDPLTRSAAGIRAAAQRYPVAGVWVIGNAPTALRELIRLSANGVLRPALVIGLPVGFVDAAAAKAELRAAGIPALSNRGPKGGTAVAAAAVNALLYLEQGR